MHDTFVPLADYLRGPAVPPPEPVPAETDAHETKDTACDEAAPLEEALAEVRRFRAALADALEVRIEALLGDVAATVLARELHIAAADVRAIVQRELALAGESPVRIRAHPDECERLRGFEGIVFSDPAIRCGDVVIELQSGTIASTLGCRLERALRGGERV